MKFSKVFIVVLIAVFAIPLAAQREERNGCSLRTLNGSYGSFAQGTFLATIPTYPTPPFQVVAVALHQFDGIGNWSLKYATSLGGEIVPWGATATGSYDVTKDCEVSVLGSTPNGTSIMFTGTITGEGSYQEVHIMYTDPARVQFGTLRKTPPGCKQETIKGTYGVFGQGQFIFGGAVPIAHVGTFVADGEGNFAGSETVKMANQKYTDTYTATYNVNPDCSVVAEITAPSGVVHEVGTITGVGPFQEVHLMNSDSGYVFADTWKKK